MGIDKKTNDFKDRLKVAVITAVYPQTRTVDIKYTSQGGNALQLDLPYSMVSGTWGSIHMPIIGDRVLVDNTMGETPLIKCFAPLNSDYLPYLDPGELGHQSENGSYVHLKNRRKRVISTNTLIDYDADTGPNGETDLEYEPGGVTIRARSKQMQDQVYSQYDEHGHIGVFDNGDVVIQSMSKNIPKGLLHFDGTSGHSWWHAGDSKVQEYIELNPVKKEVVIFSDGDTHIFSQNDQKISTYTDQIVNVCGAWQFKTGVPTANIPADFDQIVLDSDLNPGDIRIDNTGTTGAKMYLHVSGDWDIIVDQGDVNLTVFQGSVNVMVTQGDVNVTASQGDISVTASQGDVDVTASQGNATVMAQQDIDLTSNSGQITVSANTEISLLAQTINVGNGTSIVNIAGTITES